MNLENESAAEAMRQRVIEFVRRYVYLKREGFIEGGNTLDVLQCFDSHDEVVAMLVEECHVEPAEAREAFSRIILNDREDKFRLPAIELAE